MPISSKGIIRRQLNKGGTTPWQNSSQIYNELVNIITEVRKHIQQAGLNFSIRKNTPWTEAIYSGFEDEGKKRSFTVRHKNSGGGYLWDLCWISGSRSVNSGSFSCSELELVLECEWATTYSNIRKMVLEDFFKIVDARAFMKVMVFVFSDKTPGASWTELTGTMFDISNIAHAIRVGPGQSCHQSETPPGQLRRSS